MTAPHSFSSALPYRQELRDAGVAESELRALAETLAPALETLHARPAPEAAAIFACAGDREAIAQARAHARKWRERFSHLVVIGTGGSGLSSCALSLLHPSTAHAGKPTLHVLDNLDAHHFRALVNELPLNETCFLAVSKSGRTVETYAQTVLLLEGLKSRSIPIPPCFAIITMRGENPLRALADEHGIPVFDHHAALPGRFSILSQVGLLPASFMGIDAERLCAGAAAALQHNLFSAGAPAAMGAALQTAQMRRGLNISVLLSYTARLEGLTLWWRQSWAESLGKNGQGSTPLPALGPVDQHSQLQLWLDGPEGKLYTVLGAEEHSGAEDEVLPDVPEPFSYLSGRTLGQIVDAQRRATEETLVRHGRPVRRILIERADEYALGALIMHFTLEILLTAELLGVNPYDQPAVEESKRLAHAYLERE